MTMESAALDADVARDMGDTAADARTSLLPEVANATAAGRDVLGLQAAEADRTAALTGPLYARLDAGPRPRVERAARVLIVMPTREIAGRLEAGLRAELEPRGFRVLLVQGGADYAAQATQLAEGVDVLVATTGRLLDHLAKGTATLEHVELMIVDGADRMRDIRFLRDVHRIVEGLPEARQNVLLSAVASDDVREFAATILRDPVVVEVRSNEPEVAPQRNPRQGSRRSRSGQQGPRDDQFRDQPRDNAQRDNQFRDQPRDGQPRDGQPRDGQPRDGQPRDNAQADTERRNRDRQPISHESSLFPSSGPVFGYGDNRGGNRRPRGPGRRGGNY
jgi:hypothetical protein